MAFALDALGKEVAVVNADRRAGPLLRVPGRRPDRDRRRGRRRDADAVIVMECGDLTRTGVAGLERRFVINIDHHPGNRMYGAINWFDESAAACGEMVFDLISALGVPLTPEIATHIYLAILTDTGSFHYSNISPRTFDICRQTVEAGVNPAAMARRVFDSNNFGRLKLFGAVLDAMELARRRPRSRCCTSTTRCWTPCGCTYNDTEGLINLPLTARRSRRSCSSRSGPTATVRVSMRSKDDVDVRAGRQGASAAAATRTPPGFTVAGPLDDVQPRHRRAARRAPSPQGLESRDRPHERCPRRRQAARADLARRRRPGAARARRARGSAIPARSIRSRPACCRW